MIVLGIDTSTDHTSVALGTDHEIVAATQFAGPRKQDHVVAATDRLLRWSGLGPSNVTGVAVGLGPGLYTGLRVGVQAGKSLAQVLRLPVVGLPSLDVLAFGVRYTDRLIGAVLDARRGEVFFGFYRSVPGGVLREGGYRVGSPEALAAELQAVREEVLLVGNGAILYRHELERSGVRVEFAAAALAHPWASALVELAAPRFVREETDRLVDVVPLYLRKTDAEIAWDQRARGASA
ncbi:MAG TPA: tRNA (adenosine(37)-N6)-threonylcarbamoyltransferase complex dimerization subunit type 1 TsaB [Actinomycetota bacterium]|nr:tRNA (adenosine(37)-N6)-threonylcarbamoyltransferase complex dimerization subunit type 1 TsaB [Actinomycetota bacterium]